MKTIISLFIVLFLGSTQLLAQIKTDTLSSNVSDLENYPVIDVHLHIYGPATYWKQTSPSGYYQAPESYSKHYEMLVELMKTNNAVLGVACGQYNRTLDILRKAYPENDELFLYSVDFWGSPFSDTVPRNRTGILKGVHKGIYKGIGELAGVYHGRSANDEAYHYLYAVADSFSLPVSIHTGVMPASVISRFPNYSREFANPKDMEPVVQRWPNVNFNAMHAGVSWSDDYDFSDDLIRMLGAYPNFYCDIGAMCWTDVLGQSKAESLIKKIIAAGYEDKILFGSDEMVWPQAIERAIDFVKDADFLTVVQKKKILYYNPARYLKLPVYKVKKHFTKYAGTLEPYFYLDENGVTIKCENCQPGDTGTVNGVLYEAVDRSLLEKRRDEGADLSMLCTSLVVDMNRLFYNRVEFNQDIGSWDMSNVTNVSYLFYCDTSVWGDEWFPIENSMFNQNIQTWDVSNVTNMSHIFYGAEFNQPINAWDVSSVKNMSNMFRRSAFNQDIGNWDVSSVTEMDSMFAEGLTSIWGVSENNFNQDIGTWNVSNVTNMSGMFYQSTFNKNISNWNVSNVSNMSSMFSHTEWFNQDLDKWNVSNVIDMSSMFQNASRFNQNLNSWNVSKVTNMKAMFQEAGQFNGAIGNWRVGKVTDMSRMFHKAKSFNQDLGAWNVRNVTNMDSIFFGASQFNQILITWCVKNIPYRPVRFAFNSPFKLEYYPKWGGTCLEPYFYLDENGITIKCEDCLPGDTGTVNGILYEAVDRELLEQRRDEVADLTNLCTSLVTRMDSLFIGSWPQNPKIGNWDVSNVTNMSSMFQEWMYFNQDISKWDVSKVTNMSNMFNEAVRFNNYIGDWDVSSVTDMAGMFQNSHEFNQDIGEWNVSNVISMNSMFLGASEFNQAIGSWNVSRVTDMFAMFAGYSEFNQDISKWDVKNVTDMGLMFDGAYQFNQDISSWDVASVTRMDGMFKGAIEFNQPIGNWNVKNVERMWGMLSNASSFNQDLSSWCVPNILSVPEEFATGSQLQVEQYPRWGCGTGLEDAIANDFDIYPNPLTTTALIQAPNQSIIQRIELVDLTGKVVRFIDQVNSAQVILDRTGLSSGVYILKIHADKMYVTKVLIQ